MTDLQPGYLHLLALARAAIKAADDKALWKKSIERAAADHAAACDALWEEIHRQVDVFNGEIPVLEHPSVKQIKLATRLRSEIIAHMQSVVAEALDDIINGALIDEVD